MTRLRPDALIITALQDELDAVLALGDDGPKGWQGKRDQNGFRYHLRALPNEKKEPLIVAAVWAGDMGEVAAATRAVQLVDELDPSCVAMCGICAGRRGEVALGDVIVADRVYSYDHGKLVAGDGAEGEFWHDITTYNLETTWKMDAAYFARTLGPEAEMLRSARPVAKATQRGWLLHALLAEEEGTGPAPSKHPDRRARCPRWADVVEALERDGLARIDGEKGTLTLTDAGRAWVRRDRIVHPDGQPDGPPFRLHVGPIATGKTVREDPELFSQLSKLVRKTIGVEMEAAAIGAVAERLGRRSIIVKAVSDHADREKDDSFRAFACRASAGLLVAFLKRHLEPRPQPVAVTPTDERAPTLERRAKHPELEARERPRSDLVARVERVCRLREVDVADVVELWAPLPLASLLEVTAKVGQGLWRFPIGVLDRVAEEQSIEAFAAFCDSSYRLENPGVPTRLIYLGEPVPKALARRALARGVDLQSFGEYQRLFNLSGYTQRQLARLDDDAAVYPSSLYVEQRANWRGSRNDPWKPIDNTLDEIASVLDSPHGRLLVVLGDFGTGKTFLMRELCRRLSTEGGRTPVLVEMRKLEKRRTLNELLAQHFAAADLQRIDLAGFRYLLAEGKVVLLFDGFDELAFRVSYDRVLEHLGTVLEAASDRAKVVVTSRTGHFLTDRDVNKELADRAEQIGHARLVKLKPFDKGQIRHFLGKLLPTKLEADAWFDLLREVKDLLGLSHNPRLLSFIVKLPQEQLREARRRTGEISSATLYELLIKQWLKNEIDRARETGADPDLGPEQLWRAVTDLALLLWPRLEGGLSIDEIPPALIAAAHALDPKRKLEEAFVRHQLGSRSMLVRDEEGSFRFLHQSLMEWLVANAAADEVKDSGDAPVLGQREMSDLMADFFLALVGREVATRWAENTLRTRGQEAASKNALCVQRRLREMAPKAASLEIVARVNLEGRDLRGHDFSGQNLQGANLQRVDLSGAALVRADLRGARLAEAILIRADLTGAQLGGADLTGADLSWARLFEVDLQGATLTGARLHGAKLVGAQVPALIAVDAFGAVLAVPREPAPMWMVRSEVFAVAFSPSCGLLAVGRGDGTVCLCNVATRMPLWILKGHTRRVSCVAWSPDGQALASSSGDGTVRLWQTSTRKALGALEGHVGWVRSVAWSPDGQTLVSGSDDKTVRLWRASTGEALSVLEGHADGVASVTWSPDGRTLASGSGDKTVRLWRASTGEALGAFKGHTDGVTSVAWSPDGQTLASGSGDKTVRLWRASTGKAIDVFEGHASRVRGVAWSPNGQALASSSEDRTVRLWQVSTRKVLGSLDGHAERVMVVAWSPDGQTLASGSWDKTVRLWQASTGKALGALEGHAERVTSVAWSPDGQTLASGSSDTIARLWRASTGEALGALEDHASEVTSVAWSPDGRTLASGSGDKTVRLWRASTGEALGAFKGHTDGVTSVAWSPDGQTLASGSSDRTVRLWHASTRRAIGALGGHASEVTSVAWSPDGQTLASGSWDKTVRLWRASTGEALGALEGHTSWVRSVAWSPDGQTLASGSSDTIARLWRASTGEALGALEDHASEVTSVAWSPDGRTLASGSSDKTVRLWRASTGEALGAFKGHTDGVTSVAWSPDGQTLASASADSTIRFWDTTTHHCFALLLALPEGWVAFTPGGRYKFGGNIAGGFWHGINLCRFEPGELDPYVPGLRLADDAPLLAATPLKSEGG